MILFGDAIIETLKSAPYPLSVTVRDFYSAGKISPPLITVDELPGNEGVYLHNQPEIVTNLFTIEVYAAAKTIDGKPYNQKQLAMEIALAADKVLNEVYGLTMTGQIAVAPYRDPHVCRVVMRYLAYIDTRLEENNILRGIPSQR